MQFDQKALVRVGIAVAVVVAVALYGQFGGERISTIQRIDSAKTQASPSTPRSSTSIAADTRQPSTPSSSSDFDFYVLALSWSPTHCSSDRGRGRDDDLQCRSGRPYGFVLHGLWPQYERGYPADCPSGEPRAVAADIVEDMLKISPSAALVQHEWTKHGTCSGLSQADYFAAAERAFEAISIPPALVHLTQPLATTAEAVRDAFVKSNPTLAREGLSATCSRNELAEIWICLDGTLAPRTCSREVAKRHCGRREVRMRAVRGNWPR